MKLKNSTFYTKINDFSPKHLRINESINPLKTCNTNIHSNFICNTSQQPKSMNK